MNASSNALSIARTDARVQSTDGRTDGRTNADPSHLPGEPAASVTRTRTYGMSKGCWFHGRPRLHDCGSCRDAVTE